ncbi:MAG: FtsX-like permease family protein [Bacteroidales bacterium]|nr:FtsX-like permease family protein [Bacteroidales bacterium]
MAKKSHNAINIISAISVGVVTLVAMALIVILSVFNGFDQLVQSLFSTFNPDLKILPVEGKVFLPDSAVYRQIKQVEGIYFISEVLEENALLKYGDKQYIATVKGVDDVYVHVNGIDSMIVEGDFILKQGKDDFAVIGQGIAYYLSVGLNFINPIIIYVPKRSEYITYNPEQAFNREYLFPSGIFSIEQDFDSKYILVPLDFARKLLDYENEISALEIKIDPGYDATRIENKIVSILGSNYKVQNRYEQNEIFYKVMKSEKWAIFFIFCIILIVASFNMVGSLTMLIIEKKEDIATLRSLGATDQLIRKIFLVEGWLISLTGAFFGLILGSLICWGQQKFEWVKLKGSGSFVIDAYPVDFQWLDLFSVLGIVAFIGFIAAWYPVRYISKRYMQSNLHIRV